MAALNTIFWYCSRGLYTFWPTLCNYTDKQYHK